MSTWSTLVNVLICSLLLYSASTAAWQWTGVLTDYTTTPTTRTDTCTVGEVLCSDGNCIPPEWVCDFLKDCPRGEDEAKTLCGSNHTISTTMIIDLDTNSTRTLLKRTTAPPARWATSTATSQLTSTRGVTTRATTTSKSGLNMTGGKDIKGLLVKKENNTLTDETMTINTTGLTTEGSVPTEPPTSGSGKLGGTVVFLGLTYVAYGVVWFSVIDTY